MTVFGASMHFYELDRNLLRTDVIKIWQYSLRDDSRGNEHVNSALRRWLRFCTPCCGSRMSIFCVFPLLEAWCIEAPLDWNSHGAAVGRYWIWLHGNGTEEKFPATKTSVLHQDSQHSPTNAIVHCLFARTIQYSTADMVSIMANFFTGSRYSVSSDRGLKGRVGTGPAKISKDPET